jgi:hypothetical protein
VTFLAALTVQLGALSAVSAPEADDPWGPLRVLIGNWKGEGTGLGGDATVEHSYGFILQDRFLHTKTRSVGEARPDGTAGELHEDWGIFSYDSDRNGIVLRQFLTEGFVNTYALGEPVAEGALVFTTESTESAGGTQARLTFEVLNENEYRQILELAPPGKDFFRCRTMHMRRVK